MIMVMMIMMMMDDWYCEALVEMLINSSPQWGYMLPFFLSLFTISTLIAGYRFTGGQ